MRRHHHVLRAGRSRPPCTAPRGTRPARRRRLCPSLSASTSAGRSTNPPRAAFTIRTPGLHAGDGLGTHQILGLGRQRGVQRQEVRGCQHHVHRSLADLQLPEAIAGDERVVGDDCHSQSPRPGGDQLADAAEAEHAQRLAVDLDAAEARALPAPLHQRRMSLGDVARQRQQQPDRVLGGRNHVRSGRVGDDDSAPGRLGDVDVVHAGAGASHHLQALAAGEQVGIDPRRAADDQRVVLADPLGQLLGRHLDADVDVEAPPEQLHAGVGDLLLDQDLLRHRRSPAGQAPRAPVPRRLPARAGGTRSRPARARARPAR